jgi:hypothetical protein
MPRTPDRVLHRVRLRSARLPLADDARPQRVSRRSHFLTANAAARAKLKAMDVPPPPPEEGSQECAPERSSVLASPAFWLAAVGSLAFWVFIGLLIAG